MSNIKLVAEHDERGGKETGGGIKVSDSIDEQRPVKKRKQEVNSEPGLQHLSAKSNVKEQANTTISENSMPFQEKGTLGISMKLTVGASKKQKTESPLQKKTGSTASVFNESDDEEEEEEMPREAKMRMRNLGKETPTSAGPNSFNKGKRGFTHHHKVWEKSMKTSTKASKKETK